MPTKRKAAAKKTQTKPRITAQAKLAKTKPVAKKRAPRSASRHSIPAKPKAKSSVTSPSLSNTGKISFNHAMIYSKEVQRSLEFYRDMLGFKLIEDFRHEGICVYARLHAPGGDGTIALHLAGPGVSIGSEGVRLYFEIDDVDGFCRKLQQKGFYLAQMPRMMPWGWRHAYLNDPDGHEISLYWAGENRMKKTVMQAAKKAVGKS
jgi:catechol 2,3-dioxygenase-like lactoylglutathione lyase family enzyme